ncbi:molybdate metabolism regulator [Listeria booriae]|uniref:molybdate metabolism regulator n=1 Tax=Listeria booriae TaxID=1552123 RepID=UPI00162611A1|nr:molybdate metabolism regulator [Listeria booriae]MBC1560114.1 molybdate metabolism regulator [Listeria booriae]
MAINMYFDDEEVGPGRKTSHPHFVAHFKSDFYFDCSDEQAPFGSDEGADVLAELEDFFQDKEVEGVSLSDFPRHVMEDQWELTYYPPKDMDEGSLAKLIAEHERDVWMSDQVVLATAFGQIKITGYIIPELKDMAHDALGRMKAVNDALGREDEFGYYDKMLYDLMTFDKTYVSVLPDFWCKRCQM